MENRFGKIDNKSSIEPQLFSGIRLRFSALNQTEKVVCLLIILIPLWWLWGWSYLLLLLALSIFAYELIKKRELHLDQPSFFVIAMIFFGLYDTIGTYFYATFNGLSLSLRDILGSFNYWLAPASILWYIQSKRIRVRLSVVAWSFSIVVILMLILWAVIYFVWGQAYYPPPRSLFGILTGKSTVYTHGLGNNNYLILYRHNDNSIANFARYNFFFHGPEAIALVLCFITFLALEIRPKIWSLLLFSSSVFLLLISGTRSAWIAFSLVFLLRWLLIAVKYLGISLIYALIALVSFISLCLPPVTNIVFDNLSKTAEVTGEFRGDSTKVRAEIYRRTWEGIVDSSDLNFLFGYFLPGETVLPGYAPAMVGTHSFYLGSLLYRKGIIGTVIFGAYWIALIRWLYKTRRGRPIACLLIFGIFSIALCFMAFESTIMPITLIAAITGSSVNRLKEK